MRVTYLKSNIISNVKVTATVFLMQVQWNIPVQAGQFFMIKAWDKAPLLPRPISVHDYQDGVLSFLYEVRGQGTQILSTLQAGELVSLTGALGNGFDASTLQGNIALVSGGIGIAPLLLLAKKISHANVDLFCGFRETPYQLDAFSPYVKNIHIATDTGASGTKGFVTDLIDVKKYDHVLCCGPEVMMEKLAGMCMQNNVPIYVSKESHMACGVGACLVCTCKTKQGAKSVCKDGPVFKGEDIYA